MLKLLLFIYNYFLIPFLNIYFKFNFKLKRNEIISKFYNDIDKDDRKTKRIWFHSSSMGEFEQAKYIIESIKKTETNISIICTFFSNSGYENQKNYPYADFTSYLPVDSKKNANEFIKKTKPDLAVFVRYDLWVNYIKNLNQRKIPTILINATEPNIYNYKFIYQIVKPYYKFIYSILDEIYSVNEKSFLFFTNELNLNNIYQGKDTRLDRITEVVDKSKTEEILPDEFQNKDVLTLVAGSTWEKDIELISEMLNEINNSKFQIRTIIVPHKPEPYYIEQIEKLIPNSFKFTEINVLLKNNLLKEINEKHLIIDKIGILLKIYKYADIAYVGCGFGNGVHSTAEPAGYGLPIITGPNINKSPDAVELHRLGALKIINNSKELTNLIRYFLEKKEKLFELGKISKNYIEQNQGYSKILKDKILKKLTKN